MVGVHTANSTGVGFKQVPSVVQLLRAEVGFPCVSLGKPCDAHRFFTVQHIGTLIDSAKVLYSVVVNNLIDVVDDMRRFFTVIDLPSNPVSHVLAAVMANTDVAKVVPLSTEVTSLTHPSIGVDFIPNLSCIRRIGVVVSDVVRDNSTSHFKSPLDLVRGPGLQSRASDYTSLGVNC